jgi:hypothetical protein
MQTVTKQNQTIFSDIIRKYEELSFNTVTNIILDNRHIEWNYYHEENQKKINKAIKSYKKNYYDNIRIITEMYYLILDWFKVDGFVIAQHVLDSVYEKSVELEEDIKYQPEDPTEEELHIIQTFLNQIRETTALIEPYVSSELKKKYKYVPIPRRSERIRNKLSKNV